MSSSEEGRSTRGTVLIWDGAASIAIGGLLVVVAVRLGLDNKDLLIGRAADAEQLELIRTEITRTPGVDDLVELACGDYEVLDLGDPAVLGLRSQVEGTTVITVHNLADRSVDVVLDLPDDQQKMTDLLTSTTVDDGRAPFELAPYGCRWLRSHLSQTPRRRILIQRISAVAATAP